ncbi:MAG: ATP-binding protein [Eubacteriales bacterium]
MLVQFMVNNFLSFKEEVLLDMTAIKAYKEHEYNLINIGTNENFLKVATIYGANASGKTNLFLAMLAFRKLVQQSFNTIDNYSNSLLSDCYFPFHFQKDKKNIEFEIILINNGNEYKYGFEYNSSEIVAEWCYKKSLETKRTATILERTQNDITFGSSVNKFCKIYKDQIPKETLALTFLSKFNLGIDIFSNIYNEICNLGVIPSDTYENPDVLKKFLLPILNTNKSELLKFLQTIDTGISDISYSTTDDVYDFYSHHIGEDNKPYTLDLFSESEGTLKCMAIFITAKLAINNGQLLFIDELNAKLHPLLLKYIVDLFNSQENQTAQLLYTSHDTTLLDRRYFRRDQIWFVEKDEFGTSSLYALSDFKIRADASFEKDYLGGVYGGIPFIQNHNMKVGE